MIVWMNRVARHLKKKSRKSGGLCERPGARRAGHLLFVFLMVLREGAELALILRAVELSSEGCRPGLARFVGIAAAVAVGLFFFKGTLRVPLQSVLCGDERDSDARGVSAGAHGFA